MKGITLIAIGLFMATNLFGQQIFQDGEVYRNAEGELYNGPYTVYVEGSQKLAQYDLKDGQFHGNVVLYHENGAMHQMGHYVNGEKNGMWITWDASKNKRAEAFYDHGKKIGVWSVWNATGARLFHMVYHNNKKAGNWQMWDAQANLIEEREF